MKIGKRDTSRGVFIIAEIGNNHEGDAKRAEKLIRLAAKAGADAVKFQTIVPEKLVSAREKDRIEQLRRFQLSYAQFEALKKVADAEGVEFLSTPFDLESADFLAPLVPAFKIASGDNNFVPLIAHVAQIGKPLIVSAGLASPQEIRRLVELVRGVRRDRKIADDLAILHCVVSYPAKDEDADLLSIRMISELGVVPGYSDHTIGIDAAVLSVALGARIIEKHFTDDKNYSQFRDHQLSADAADLTELVVRVRRAEKLLGDGKKTMKDAERENALKVRRSIVAKRDLERGSVVLPQDITWVRPGGGLAPGEEKQVLGRRLSRAVLQGEMIRANDVEG